MQKYLVTAIVSTYNSERFIQGCLEDLEAQTISDELQILVINSGSQQNEEGIVKEFQKKYSNIKYIKTEQRETIYQAWNYGIKEASGEYITNANTDDRHRWDALEILARELHNNPHVALVYADQIITQTENETFEHCTPYGYFQWPAYDRSQLLHTSCVGPQPMWRKNLHSEMGYFDSSLKIAGDYEWWLRISEKYSFKHISELLGLYLLSLQGVEYSNAEGCKAETEIVRKRYIEKAKICLDYNKYKSNFMSQTYNTQSAERVSLQRSVFLFTLKIKMKTILAKFIKVSKKVLIQGVKKNIIF